jgi:hypothetical protein
MARTEKLRDALTRSPTFEYLNQMNAAGWRLVAMEWERDAPGEPDAAPAHLEEIPYGMQVAADGCSLVENAAESRILSEAARLLVEDMPVSRIAAELNSTGYRTRRAALWTPTDVFNLVPRMIDAGPRLFTRR